MKECHYIPEKEAYLISEQRGNYKTFEYSDTHYNEMTEKDRAQIDIMFDNAFKNTPVASQT